MFLRFQGACVATIAPVCCCMLMGCHARTTDLAGTYALFQKPPREYATAPLWVWNDLLTDEQITGTMRDLAGQNVKQVFVHPRPGLMTPYLSDEWFRLWKLALAEAEKLDMNVWIYDENSYPSGFAGGFVPDAMPESRGRGLAMKESPRAPAWSGDTVAVYSLNGSGYENVSDKLRSGQALPDGKYVACTVQRAHDAAWTAGKSYVDLLYPGVVDKFLDVTMERYRRELGEHFGKRLPGAFTDEPQLQPAGGLPWTDRLPQEFEKRWGYPLLDHLVCLNTPVGDYKRVRHNYLQLLHEMFVESWGKPYHDFCERNHLEFTGHYWEHDWPICLRVPDSMAMYAWHQRPAIDVLMNQYNQESPNAQFGNVRIVKELSSVVNQLGQPRTLCEAYGAGGWDLRFEDMKRIGDWLYVLGVNTLDEHLSYITIRGARKHDHPQSFSYHEPWWEAYHVSAGYFARLSAALSRGEQVNKILLLEPTSSAWMYNSLAGNEPNIGSLGGSFQKLVTSLALAQVEYDIGCEDIMARHGATAGSELVIGKRRYDLLVLPQGTENLNSPTLRLLANYLKGGGKVLACGDPPSRIDGTESTLGKGLTRHQGWKQVSADDLPDMLAKGGRDGFSVRQEAGGRGILFHHRRQLSDGELLFLVNTSLEHPCTATFESAAQGVVEWNLENAAVEDVPFEGIDGGIRASVELAPGGSRLLALSKTRRGTPVRPRPSSSMTTLKPQGDMKVRRVEPNVLTLDYVDVRVSGETQSDLDVGRACKLVFTKHGLDRNPWDRAVQFEDEFIKRRFPSSSGFEATYRFAIREKVPSPLWIVIERADSYAITCNDKEVKPKPGQWWLDKSFGKIDISSEAEVGENKVTIKASPFQVFQEIQAAYVLGDFALEPTGEGFAIVPAQPLKTGPWNKQGLPLYAHGVGYTQTFDVGTKNGRYYVSLPAWLGSVAEVKVNGKSAGYVWHQPWQCEVTEQLRAGNNEIEITVIGTLKNTLGPHHGDPGLGSAWPGMWDKAPEKGPPPGEKYSTVGYGLFEPFTLKRGS